MDIDMSVCTKKIKKDMIVKNYKEMCSLLGEKPLQGNSKKSQEKKWSLSFLYEKSGHKYIVKKIYNKKLYDEQKNPKSYTGILYNCLLSYLHSCKFEDNKTYVTKNSILKKIGMVNSIYGERDVATIKKVLSSNSKIWDKIENSDIMEFYRLTNSRSFDYLRRVMNKMEKNNIIKCNDVYFLLFEDSFGDKSKTIKRFEPVPKDDCFLVDSVYEDVVDDFGYVAESDLVYKGTNDRKTFYEEVNRRLKDRFGCVSHTKAIEITLVDKEGFEDYFADNLKSDYLKISNDKFLKVMSKAFETSSNGLVYDKDLKRKRERNEMEKKEYLKKSAFLTNALVKLKEKGELV